MATGDEAGTNGELLKLLDDTVPQPLAAEDLLPNALDHLPQITKILQPDRASFFLDYDGTLTPIVNNPDEAVLSEQMRQTVQRLAKTYPASIVSGRARLKVKDFVQVEELWYAGSHGFDITGPHNTTIEHQVAQSFRPSLERGKSELNTRLAAVDGFMTEDNLFAVTAHWRMCDEEGKQLVAQTVAEVVSSLEDLQVTNGKCVFELRPKINWDKGKAVQWLVQTIGAQTGTTLVPCYIGDDVSDEDAFREVNSQGGISIKVGMGTNSNTAALYRLTDPLEVGTFLSSFVS